MIAAAFDQAEARDRDHLRHWVVLVDGARHQLDLIRAEAGRRHIKVHVLLDFVHVAEYVWAAAHCFHKPGTPAAEFWVAAHLTTILHGQADRAAAEITAEADRAHLHGTRRESADACVRYLTSHLHQLRYDTALAAGWPIATGPIEGACRHLIGDRPAATDGGRVAIGRPQPGPGGVVQSYEEALGVLELAERLDLDDPVLRAADLLVYPVLTRDRQAMADLVADTLGPLTTARGGAQPLLDTLTAYFDSGCVAAEAARRLTLSVRALTYRLERIHKLTGANPADPTHRYMLQTAVIGARLLDWPPKDV